MEVHSKLRRFILLGLIISGVPSPWTRSLAQKPGDIPFEDAEAGPCSVDITATDVAGNPVYAAVIRVRISRGTLGVLKTNLEIRTDKNGRARFAGLPQETDEVLYIRASRGRTSGSALISPTKNCDAECLIILRPR